MSASPDAAPPTPAEPAPPTTVPLTEPAEGVPPVCQTPEALNRAAAALAAGTGPVAVDAERASGYRYGQRAYLVQLRREGAGTVLIDPVALPDLAPVQQALEGAEWVLHAADQDLPCLAEVGLRPARLFDTELAARLLGRDRVGLAAVIAEELGYTLAKEHSAVDWSTRPLPADWLRYAALDVELLVPLRDRLTEHLAAAGKLEWALQEFEHVRTAPPPAPKVDPWRRLPGASAVRSPRGLAVLRELWAAREEVARQRDRSPGRVLANAAVVAAAQAQPRTVSDLVRLPEFAGRGTRRHAKQWHEAIARALALPDSELPPRRPPQAPGTLPAPRGWQEKNPEAAARLDAVRGCVRARAAELQLPQENLLSPELQRQLAWHAPTGTSADQVARMLTERGARPWQVDLLRGPLAEALAEQAGQTG